MVCEGNFIFKEIKKTNAGQFTNRETGQVVDYEGSFKLKVDEVTDDGITERIFKLPLSADNLYAQFLKLEPYDKITIAFELYFNNYDNVNTNARLVPVSFELAD